MRCGYLSEQGANEIVPISYKTAWKPAKRGLKSLKLIETAAYACPECGYIEQYVKNIEEGREIILLASTSCDK
jgi:hypothetical protein